MNNGRSLGVVKFVLRVMVLMVFTGGIAFAQVTTNFSWSRSGVSSLGPVRSLALNPSSYSGTPYILAGTISNGVYRSTDNGASWLQTGLPNLWVECLLTAGSGMVYAGTVKLIDGTSLKVGLYISSDGGATWSPPSLINHTVQAIAVKDNMIFAGTHSSGLYVSADTGVTWKLLNDSLKTYNGLHTPDVTALLVDGGNLVAGTNAGVFISADNGKVWTGDGMRNMYIHALAIGGSGAPAGKIFAATDFGVYVSTVGDTNWIAVNSGLTDSSTTDIATQGNNVYVSTASGLFESTNEGGSWSPVNLGLYAPNVLGLAAGDSIVLAGTSGDGVFLTRDGSNWLAINSDISTVGVAGFAADAGSIYAATSGGVYFSPDSGRTWNPKSYGLVNNQVTAVLPNGNTIFAGTSYGLYVSTDKGETWSVIDSMATMPITALALDGGTVLAGTNNYGVFTSSDNGGTWEPSDSGLTSKAISGFVVTSQGVFVGTNGSGVFSSTDNGKTWTAANKGLGNANVTCIATNGPSLFVGTKGGPYVAPVSSVVWTAIEKGLPAGSVNSISASGPYLFVGIASNGVFASIDTGSTWTAVNSGLSSEYGNIKSMIISGKQVFAGGAGNLTTGIWTASLDNILSVDNPVPPLPAGYSLSQNFPNPFNPTTVIRYQLPAAGYVTLKVYDVLGRRVATLVSGKQASGMHDVEFDGSRFASGVYFYRLEAGTFSKTRKMLLLK